MQDDTWENMTFKQKVKSSWEIGYHFSSLILVSDLQYVVNIRIWIIKSHFTKDNKEKLTINIIAQNLAPLSKTLNGFTTN